MAERQPTRPGRKPQDLSGQRFEPLLVLSFAGNGSWNCLCDCGQQRVVRGRCLASRHTRSCGCFARENRPIKHGLARRGKCVPEFNLWRHMAQRCFNPANPGYPNYGGRGITMCARWRDSFVAFLEDMGPRPSPAHSVDRFPNQNGNYEPGNCRWATPLQQSRNSRNNTIIEYKGERLCMAEWGERFHIHPGTIYSRLVCYKWSVERALTTPVRPHRERRHH
jgi:hypothetical protein